MELAPTALALIGLLLAAWTLGAALLILHALGNRAGALPYTVVLSRAGGIAWRKLGQVEPGELEPVLDDILG